MQLDDFQPSQYHALLDQKVTKIVSLFDAYYSKPLTIFASPAEHFRYRCEFRFWHHEGNADFAIFPQGENKEPILIEQYPIASRRINDLMPLLKSAIMKSSTLRRKLFQVEFLTSTLDQALISLIYHKPLDDEWEKEAQQLEIKLGIHVIGRSKKQKTIISQDYVEESFTVNHKAYLYRQYEGGFIQPNPYINKMMLNWVIQNTPPTNEDLLELYCGNGNFTIPLSKQFKKVLATEISKRSINNLLFNIKLNENHNIRSCRLSSEEISQALKKIRKFRRLEEKKIKLDDYCFSTIFVDPPRAGLDEQTLTLISSFEKIIYISCNPNTLLSNISSLSKTHQIETMALFDQFPYTSHTELGVILKKIN